MSLKIGSVAVIVGGGRGIGECVALDLAKAGAKVAVCDIDGKNAESVAEKIREAGGEAISVVGDASVKADAVKMVTDAKEKWGSVDILVNCAIVLRDRSIRNMTEEEWDTVIRIGLRGTFLPLQSAAEAMKENKYGRIVNFTSPSYNGTFGQANYSAAKGGVNSLTKTACLEYAKYGVTVNAVAPGVIDTPLTKEFPEDMYKAALEHIPAKRFGLPKDVSDLVLFLCGEDSGYITGQIIHVDGGVSLAH